MVHIIVFFLIAVATGCAPLPGGREAGPPSVGSMDLAAIHDSASPQFDGACLKCHGDVMRRTTRNPSIKEAHAAMVPFLPDFDPKTGPTNANCTSCHSRVDVIQHSGAQLRKNTDMSGCEGCHGKTGSSAKKFYAN